MSFAKMTAVFAVRAAAAGRSGIVVCGREYMNSLDESSMAEVKAAIRSEQWLDDLFDIGEKYIRTKCGKVSYKFVGLVRNLASLKSKAKILLLWIDEAEGVLESSWRIITPTVREHDSEIWVTWNPEIESSATHKRFVLNPPKDSKIIELNFQDNPFFPEVLEKERLEDLEKRPDDYDHVWGGAFKTSYEGAYFSKHITKARQERRIGVVAADPLMTLRAFWDIGGTGNKADACTIWIAQFIGSQIKVLDYYEAQGQPLATHVQWLRKNGYGDVLCILPHDGVQGDKVYSVSFESALKTAGFDVEVVKNQGTGAAMLRVEAVRRLFPNIWINEETTKGGMAALSAYHEKRDEARNIGLGPNHNWASHGADSFGLMCISFELPKKQYNGSFYGNERSRGGSGWMGG
ncbi:MAG: phage terminase large subunit [Flavobacteriales bacterium]|nr:phage terminase large subunit [Flavobacteriales bacterium]